MIRLARIRMLVTSNKKVEKISLPVRGSTKQRKRQARIEPLPQRRPIKLRLRTNHR